MNEQVSQIFDQMTAVQKEVFLFSEEWAKAMVANDANSIGSFIDESWRMISKFGVSNKSDFLAFIKSGDLTHSTFDLKELSELTVYQNTAVLIGRITNTANYRGMTFEADEWTTDIFKKTDSGWKCILTHITDAVDRSQT